MCKYELMNKMKNIIGQKDGPELVQDLQLFKKYANEYKVDDKQIAVACVKKILNENDATYGKKNKKKIAIKMFAYLHINNHLFSSIKFKETVQKRLEHFQKNDNWETASEILYFYLFGKTLGNKKRNFEYINFDNIPLSFNKCKQVLEFAYNNKEQFTNYMLDQIKCLLNKIENMYPTIYEHYYIHIFGSPDKINKAFDNLLNDIETF